MTSLFGSVARSSHRRAALAVGLVVVAVSVGVFVIGAEGATPDPVPFDDTVKAGMSSESEQVLKAEGATIPRAEVFHAQYQFIVGYQGVGHMIDELQRPGHAKQFGRPVAIYVSDYADTDPTVTAEGYPRTASDPDWVRAQDALFVVDSSARTPAGDAVLPFSSRAEAETFQEAYGGEIIDWEAAQSRDIEIDHAGLVRDRVETMRIDGDEQAAAVRPLADRNDSLVVGQDAPTIRAAINASEPGQTIRVPAGTYEYEEPLRIDRPVTIEGPDATIRGDGNGSVITVTSDSVAITGLSIEGVGSSTDPSEGEVDQEQWDAFIEAGYGHSDAAIEAENVSELYVADLDIETPTSGVVLRDVENAVVERISVLGSDDHRDGFMGVLSIRSPAVVQNSTFEDGRDGIYIHRGSGSVIRNNRFVSNRYGVHLMYTSDSLIADNVAREAAFGGATIMTNPSGNAVVGNDIRNSMSGLDLSGTHTYVAENTLADNNRGILGGTDRSLYERNVLYGNELGFRTGTIRPSNRVVKNDFVANDRPVKVGAGPLRIWNHDGEGNYWSGRPAAFSDGPYSPTAPLDSNLNADGVGTLASSPAATALEVVRDTVAGSRQSEILDTAPRSEPVRPRTIDELERTYDD